MRKLFVIFLAIITILAFSASSVMGCNRVVVRQGDDLVKVFSAKNTKYIIKENLDLCGRKVKIGCGSTLVFCGGSMANGTVVGNNTKVKAKNYEIFKRGYMRYRACIEADAKPNSPPTVIKEHHNCLVIEGTWNNKTCGTNWTGLTNGSEEDVMLAVKNYVLLHREGSVVVFPTFNALGYESTKLPSGYVLDFNNSYISYPDNLDVWVDKSISIPDGSKSCSLESGYGLISTDSHTTIKNLYIDGKSTYRQDEPIRLGVSCIISIGNAKNVIFDNVSISNVLGPAVTVQSGAKDLTFKNCRFYNIGEHIVYSHQYLGYCHFEGCTFDTWDSERLSVYRNGLDYLYKHTPPVDEKIASYDELYHFELTFSECTFNNPKRVNEQGRTLGGFLTCVFPVVVELNDCKFLGHMPAFNPGSCDISEKSGKVYSMIVKGCDGAPYVYSTRSGGNVLTEFYDCVNIPFRTVYAKRYERCKLFLDVNENNIENVSSSFEMEFGYPLIIKDCEFTDIGTGNKINHPIFHRAVIFEHCKFVNNVKRDVVANIVIVKADSPIIITYTNCVFDIPDYSLVGGNYKEGEIVVENCDIKAISPLRTIHMY